MQKKQNDKQYKISASPLYKLQRKNIPKVLKIDFETINLILANLDKYYYFSEAADKKGKVRKYSTPITELLKVHKQLSQLLKRIESPNYLYSKKGESYTTNAFVHKDAAVTSKLDIANFYPSTSFGYVYNFYKNLLQCNADVATILTRLSIYNNSLPTGSCLSNILCFYAHYGMFEEINKKAIQYNIKFSLFRDDVFFSGKGCFKFVWEVQKIIRKYGLKYKRKKIKKYLPGKPREITGVIIQNNKVKLRNRSHKAIYEECTALEQLIQNKDYSDATKINNILNTLTGRINEANTVTGDFEGKKEHIKNIRKHFEKVFS